MFFVGDLFELETHYFLRRYNPALKEIEKSHVQSQSKTPANPIVEHIG